MSWRKRPPCLSRSQYGSFTKAQLYQAIISELGAQRGVPEDAGDSYFIRAETKIWALFAVPCNSRQQIMTSMHCCSSTCLE